MSIKTTNPTTNKIIKSFEEMTDKAVDAAIAQATKAYSEWRKTTYPQRADLLHKVANLMRQKKESLAKLVTLEMGKLLAQAEGEIILSADILDYYADNAATFLADKTLSPKYGKQLCVIALSVSFWV
jgi:succinate-semialdehyde dehydrogenase / glutarate-semialdehyde dehydrogenase